MTLDPNTQAYCSWCQELIWKVNLNQSLMETPELPDFKTTPALGLHLCAVCMNPPLDTCTVFFKLINLSLFFSVLGFHCCTWAFSSYSEQELVSSCSAQASHLGSFSCGSRLWSTRAQQQWCIDLAVPYHVESSCTRDWTLHWQVSLKLDHQRSPWHNILVTLSSEYEEK